MAAKHNNGSEQNRSIIEFTLSGLVIFSISLIAATGLSIYGLSLLITRHAIHQASNVGASGNTPSAAAPAHIPPWGELLTSEINLERPQEYLAFDINTNRQMVWTFPQMNPDQIRSLMQQCGLTTAQIQSILTSRSVAFNGNTTKVSPDDNSILSLSPEVRSHLYDQLAQHLDNPAIQIPWIVTEERRAELFNESKMNATAKAAFKKLLYQRNGRECFSDQEVMLRQLENDEQRVEFIQTILSQKAVLVRMRIRPDTDIDKLIGYWVGPASGVRYKDVRPLLDSLKGIPDGGTVSLLYFLPQFARQRLYTFPFMTGQGENKQNCHWSTMNFFNDPPDDRFYDLGYMSKHLHENFYQIASATAYGDVILLLDARKNLIHSAIYLCDDLVFTKNGNSHQQPWAIMHMKDLMAIYAATPEITTSVWRNKAQ